MLLASAANVLLFPSRVSSVGQVAAAVFEKLRSAKFPQLGSLARLFGLLPSALRLFDFALRFVGLRMCETETFVYLFFSP